MKRMHKLFSLFLTLCIAVSALTGYVPANAVSNTASNRNESFVTENVDEVCNEEFALPDIIDSKEAIENDYIGRVKTEEMDLYTFVFANGDGTNTMRVFSHPVKYVTDDGSIRDIALDIEAKTGGGFITADHEIVTTFENKLSDGISLEYDDVEIMLVPEISLGMKPTATLSNDGKVVTYEMDDNTSFVYQLTYAGFKEDIVVDEYTGQTEYEFTLFTNGLTLCEEFGSYYLADEKGNVAATIGDIIIFTADERNNTMGSMTYKTVRANQEYILTIHLDSDYLADEDTVYPIRIDPTIEINYDNNGAGAIEDVTINQNVTFSGTSGSLYIGRHPAGSLSRVLMRFPNLSLSGIPADQITAATVELRDLMCQGSEDFVVECCIYNSSSPEWSENGTTNWSSVGTSYVGSLLDSHLVSYGEGNVSGDWHRYSFDILTAAKAWANGTQSPLKGLVFKADSSFENQTGTEIKTWYKTFSSYNRAEEYQPSLSIIYSYIPLGGSSFNEAETIAINTSCFVNIVSSNEKKYFKFVPSTTGFYTFESSAIVSCDPNAWLYNSSYEILTNNDDGALNHNFRLTYHLTSGIPYYFAAGCFSSGTGSYYFRISYTTSLSQVNASLLYSGAQLPISIDMPNKAKYYKFTPTVTGEYLFVSSDNSADPVIWVYNSELNQVGYNDDSAGEYNFKLSITLVASETYYFVVKQFANNTGNCRLNVLFNRNLGITTARAHYESSSGVIYNFFPEFSGTYSIETAQPNGVGAQNTVVYLLDSNYNLITSNDNKSSNDKSSLLSTDQYSKITTSLTAGQQYKVLVTSYPDNLSFNCYIAIYKSSSLCECVNYYASFVKNFKKIGDNTNTYNCLAYAIGRTDLWEWPWGYNNPSLSQVTSYMSSIGYVQIPEYQSNCIVAYGTSSSNITHFSKSVAGSVTAKCGGLELMEHDNYDAYFENSSYGIPQAYYIKSSSTMDLVDDGTASILNVYTSVADVNLYLSELDSDIEQQVNNQLNQIVFHHNGLINSYDLIYSNNEAFKMIEKLGNDSIPYIIKYVIESDNNGMFEAFLIASIGEMLNYNSLPGNIESNCKYSCDYIEYSPKYFAYQILMDTYQQ